MGVYKTEGRSLTRTGAELVMSLAAQIAVSGILVLTVAWSAS